MVNVKNAFIAAPPIDGGVYFRAPLGTDLPKEPRERLDPKFGDHGAIGEDGYSVSQTRTSNDINMFGGGLFIDVQTDYQENVVITFLEDDNDEVLKTAFGDANVEITEATDQDGKRRTIYHTSEQLPICSHVVKARSGDKAKTYVIERGRVDEVADVPESHSDVTRRQITIKTFRSTKPGYKGANVVELRDDGEPRAVTGGDESGDGEQGNG